MPLVDPFQGIRWNNQIAISYTYTYEYMYYATQKWVFQGKIQNA